MQTASLRPLKDGVDHLVYALPADGLTAFGAMGMARSGVEQAQIIMDLSDRAHSGAGIVRGGFLVYGNGRRQAVYLIHVRLRHLPQEHPGVGGQGFDVAALAFGIDRVKGQAALAAAGQAGQHHQFVPGDIGVDVFKIMLACASYLNKIFAHLTPRQ